jgi:hypothetical protein
VLEKLYSANASAALQCKERSERIDATLGADPFVSRQGFLTEETGVGAKPPFFYTEVRAEGQPAFRNLQFAPTAQIAALGALGKLHASG